MAARKRRPVGSPSTTRLRKVECDCGNLVYQSRARIRLGLLACPCGRDMVPADPDDAALVLAPDELERHPAVVEYREKVRSVLQGQGPNAHRFGGDHYVSADAQAAAFVEKRRRERARAAQLAAIAPRLPAAAAASDPIPF